MFGSCRLCYRPTDRWQDFCNDCATKNTSSRFSLIRGGKSRWERENPKKNNRRWLAPVPPPQPTTEI